MDRGSSYMSQQSDVSAEVRQRFSSTKYITSVAGILKVVLIILFLLGGILFLTLQKCPNTTDWYAWLYPTVTLLVAVLSLGLYAVFLFAIAKTNLNFWAAVDVIESVVAAVIVIVVCVLTILQCTSDDVLYMVPAPLGLIGAVLLAANAAATYIMWKYQNIEAPEFSDHLSFPRNFIRRLTRTIEA